MTWMRTKVKNKTLIVITGPTAAGKTQTTIELAKKLNTEIICADARQFYKEIKITTVPPTLSEKNQVKHHLTGHLSIHDYYNASMFEKQALEIIDNLFKNTDYVLLTGGSGLYIDAVCNGIDDIPDIPGEIRKQVQQLYASEGMEGLKNKLKETDPEYYNKVDKNNPNRMMRGIEVFLSSGNKLSDYHRNRKANRDFQISKIILNLPREELFTRINQRVDQMVASGMIEEAKQFYPLRHLNAMKTVGFKELFTWLDGDYTLEEAIEKIKVNTRRYAKRQLTWFKKYEDAGWFMPSEKREILNFVGKQSLSPH